MTTPINNSSHDPGSLMTALLAIAPGSAVTLRGQFSTVELEALGRLGTLTQLRAEETYRSELDSSERLSIVVAGTGRVLDCSVGPVGETVASVGTGAILGVGTTVVATTTLSIFMVGPTELVALLAECPRINRQLRRLVARSGASR